MADEQKKKRKRDYHLMLFIDNDKGEIKQMGIGRAFIEILGAVIAVIIIVLIVGWSLTGSAKSRAQLENTELTAKVATLQESVDELTTENDELSSKVEILSNTVNTKVEEESEQQKQDEEAHLPEGFPLSASASMVTDEDNPDTVLFNCSVGSNIIAAGAGTVTSVIPDATYGYCVKIDHENGYVTEYYNASTPLVKEGDEVLEGSAIFVVEEGNDTFAYKVYKDEQAVDPMSIIKIDG